MIEHGDAERLDAADPLAGFRERFVRDDPDTLCLDGNSLGRLPLATRRALHERIDQWGAELVTGWDEAADVARACAGREIGLVSLSHVAYRSGALADVELITREAPAPLIWDLSHSAGAVAIGLHRRGVELAVGCTYALTSFLVELHDEALAPLGFELGTPRNPTQRGGHVSLRHADAASITDALIKRGKVIPDFRGPDSIRLGLSPLYTSFADVHEAVVRLRGVIA